MAGGRSSTSLYCNNPKKMWFKIEQLAYSNIPINCSRMVKLIICAGGIKPRNCS